jgi:hypothetical protein
VQNLLADVPRAFFSDCADTNPLLELLPHAKQIAGPVDLRVPITRTGMVVGSKTDPAGYQVVAKLRRQSGGAAGDRWLPSPGSSVYLMNGPATQAIDLPDPALTDLFSRKMDAILGPRQLVLSKVTVVRIAQDAFCFLAPLTGAAEIPPVKSYAHGRVWLFLDSEISRLRFLVVAADIRNVLEVHLHHGLPTVNQPPVAVLHRSAADPGPFFMNAGSLGRSDLREPFAGDFEGLANALRNGELYANVHTVEHPSGEIRGQFGAY